MMNTDEDKKPHAEPQRTPRIFKNYIHREDQEGFSIAKKPGIESLNGTREIQYDRE